MNGTISFKQNNVQGHSANQGISNIQMKDGSQAPLIMFVQNNDGSFGVNDSGVNIDDKCSATSMQPSIKVKNLEMLTQQNDSIRPNAEVEINGTDGRMEYLNSNFGIDANSRIYAVVIQHPTDLYEYLENSPDENIFCPYCFKQFDNKPQFESHIKSHIQEAVKTPIGNNIDGNNADQSSNNNNQSVAAHGKPFSCEFCYKGFSRKDNMIRHVRTHEKQYVCNCEICGKQFYRTSHLMAHIRSHNKERPFNCPCCEKQFSRKDVLRKHVDRTHPAPQQLAQNSYQNPDINISNSGSNNREKSFKPIQVMQTSLDQRSNNTHFIQNMSGDVREQNSNNEVHKNYNGNMNAALNCHVEPDENDCVESNDISCVEYLKIDYHIESDKSDEQRASEQQLEKTKSEDLMCPYCKKYFELTSHVQMHIKLHTMNLLKPYAGDSDGKLNYGNNIPYVNNNASNANNRNHSSNIAGGGGGDKRYTCLDCNKTFTRNDHLKVHIMSVHEHVKPFICQYCNKAFARKDHLVRHERSHTKEKPYCCHYCNSWFSQNASLLSHVKSKHSSGQIGINLTG